MSMPKAGETAPDFAAPDQHGTTHTLSQYRGRKVALYFYPADDTPGCTAQACNLRDNHERLQTEGYVVIGVSPDGVESHKKFAEKHRLPFTLLADPEKKILTAYGAWGEKKLYGKTVTGVKRTTFLIDENGNIERVIASVRTGAHAEQILKK
ncbi:MAG: thioredoxin-dependent thiol peroxidase [Bacteroidia bacterium]|nr:thioredoxin-dependent thiol peroxidase [Bacteroidia bacterium]MDW8332613.1 thioredoxin-dependent thiol peroxidase [Bacteroidia bacterium]